jgi:adenylate kinase
MYFVILGPPGSGKGTQGKLLSERLELPKIATGDLLRDALEAKMPLGQKAKQYMDRGELVPDTVIMGLVGEQLERPEAANGAIFDGFPRTIPQAEALDRLLSKRGARLRCVLLFDVAEEEVVRRMMRRSKVEGRSDDDPATVQRRLQVYQQATAPLIAYYGSRGIMHRVQGTGEVNEVSERIRHILGR